MAKYTEWITPEGLLKIEGMARDGLAEEQIAHNMGIGVSTLFEWKNRFPELLEALKKGKEVVDREVENALYRRAVGYTTEEVVYERIVDSREAARHDGVQELTQQEWEMCKAYFDNACCYCGEKKPLTKDHLVPLSEGGQMTLDNIVPACQSCNSSKNDRQWAGWYTKHPKFDRDRYERICKYLDFAVKMKSVLKSDEEGRLVMTKKVVKPVNPDVTAQIFWLKNRKPEMWRDKQDITVEGQGMVQIIDDLAPDEYDD